MGKRESSQTLAARYISGVMLPACTAAAIAPGVGVCRAAPPTGVAPKSPPTAPPGPGVGVVDASGVAPAPTESRLVSSHLCVRLSFPF